MKFAKYQALGNDYIVIRPEELQDDLTKEQIELICHRNYGVGSDGILLGPLPSERCDFRLRILNPDGSEAEKSGNGLRIFSRYLWDEGLVQCRPFTVETLGGPVTSTVAADGASVTVEMGGYTLASGSSSTAAAGVARRLNLCDPAVTVHMPGGRLQISFADGFNATMRGPVVRTFAGVIDEEAFGPGEH